MTDPAERLHNEAVRAMQAGRRAEAIGAFRQLLALRPAFADGWYNLGYLLKAEGQYAAALEAYGQALARGVSGPEEVRLNRAVIFADNLRKEGEARAELEAALAIRPDYLPALLNLGNLQEERGEREAAAACYDRLLVASAGGRGGEGAPALRGEALARLSHLRPPASAEDPLLAQLKGAAGAKGLDAMTLANLNFALGRALDRLGLYPEAFRAFREANRCARLTGAAYDRARMERSIEAMIAAFPAGRSGEGAAPAASQVPALVFICGMFRSGSTLAEQALAGHPRVTAGGELNILHTLAARALAPFPASMATLADERAARLADDYLAEVRRLFPQTDHPGAIVTDKRPDNFLLVGLIKRLFPDAKIVHTVRHPLDTGLSLYSQHIDQHAAGYSSDLSDIAHYYAQYQRLMAHWKKLFPESIYDFDYDAFVAAPKEELQKLLAFLGLDWDERCLDVHKRDNVVKTASYWQVRRPLYKESSGRWRNYAQELAPLRDALKAQGVPLPDNI